VGTARRAIAIRTPSRFFVGPDNGIFSLVLLRERNFEARILENPRFFKHPVSNTFHGRDIFAPVSAYLALGTDFRLLGPPCSPLDVSWAVPAREGEKLCGEVIYIDHFGNCVTNLDREFLRAFAPPSGWNVHVGNTVVSSTAGAFGDVKPGEPLALPGSSGRLEIAVNQGNASESLGIRTGDRVFVVFPPEDRPSDQPA
jgi:S-adenosyl-L-methionine hydrolase (adenosine-forming)